jgi:aryl-alcohol dehydrogenase-like predicted oxidoreductase
MRLTWGVRSSIQPMPMATDTMNEQLVGRAVANRRSESFVTTKFGIVFDPNGTGIDMQTG